MKPIEYAGYFPDMSSLPMLDPGEVVLTAAQQRLLATDQRSARDLAETIRIAINKAFTRRAS